MKIEKDENPQPFFSSADLRTRQFKESEPGSAPYVRGLHENMYSHRPWTIRQYAGFSTAEESNLFYRQSLAGGQTGLSVAFDLATHRGYDSDHERVAGDVGKAGVAIDSVEDMKILFSEIPLDKVSVSMTMNGAVLPVLAAFIVAGEELGVPRAKLTGTIQNDILKEYIVRNTYIYPPQPSMRIVGDIIAFTSEQMPCFNSVSISGYHMHEAGADAAHELAYTIADGLEYVKEALSRGLVIDDFAPRLSFFFAVGMNFFAEIAKLRAARMLWQEAISIYQPKNPKSLLLRTHCQTSGYSLTEQDPLNNIVRTSFEALAAVLGGTQSLHTNSFDEALGLPTDEAARIARNTQLILQNETEICKVTDPLGGSYYVEALTLDLVNAAKKIMAEVSDAGGMVAAIQKGIPKRRIEETAARTQAALDSGKKVVVGVNRFVAVADQVRPVAVREVDLEYVRENQIKRLLRLKADRDASQVGKSLEKLKLVARGGGNLLAATIDCMKVRATLGEVSASLEEVFGRYQAQNVIVPRVYGAGMEKDLGFTKARQRVLDFEGKTGRRPRLAIVKLGQDGHDRGAKILAAGLADLGFDIDLGPLFQNPREAAKLAIECGVHAIGVSTQAAGHKTLIPALKKELELQGGEEILIFVGGVIPSQDHAFLLNEGGASTVLGPGRAISEMACTMLDLIEEAHADG